LWKIEERLFIVGEERKGRNSKQLNIMRKKGERWAFLKRETEVGILREGDRGGD